MTGKYKVGELNNVVETLNLEPPEWYIELVGGYLYRWTNLTNLTNFLNCSGL